MILAITQHVGSSDHLLTAAAKLASDLGKKWSVALMNSCDNDALNEKLSALDITPDLELQDQVALNDIVNICETNEISFLFIQLTDNRKTTVGRLLKACRGLRIPYVFYKNDFGKLHLGEVIVPVGFLQEEIEKAQFAAAFGRFSGSHITLLQANDYGSRAALNVVRMKELFNKFAFAYDVEKAKRDSFKVEFDAVERAATDHAGLIIVSASRDYGLDDIIFGPKELHLIRRSATPVLLVNPRGDLYALCD